MELPGRRRKPAHVDDELELRARIAHLESTLEELQDSVYRDKRRHEQELADMRKLLDPANLARALSDDARRRGL
jgi:uncharacterized coiled-coil protein SlyX